MKDAGMPTQMPDEKARKSPRLSARKTARLGKEIYERKIRQRVEPDHIGEFIAIDVNSGCWALGVSTMDARDRLDELKPDAVDVLMERIGYEAVGSIGGGTPRRVA